MKKLPQPDLIIDILSGSRNWIPDRCRVTVVVLFGSAGCGIFSTHRRWSSTYSKRLIPVLDAIKAGFVPVRP